MRDLRYAIRSLLATPGFSLTAILSLALGIGAGVAAFSVVDAVRFRALPFKDGDRLVVISETTGDGGTPPAPCQGTCETSYHTFAEVLKIYPFRQADLIAGFTSGAKALNLGGDPIVVSGGVVSYPLFDMLGIEPMLGRRFTADDDKLGAAPVTVISYDLWVNNLGRATDIIGQTIKLSDTRYGIIGVMPQGFEHEVGSKFWLASVPTLDPSTRPSIRSLTVLARLKPGVTLAQFNAELGSIDPNLLRQAGTPAGVVTQLNAAPLRDRYVGATQGHDLIFAAVVGCILLIAVSNLANLMLVRTIHRQREFAIQAALGAGTGRIVTRLLAEQLVLVLAATGLALGLARGLLGILKGVTVLQSLRPAGMDYQLDRRAIGFAVLLAAVISAVLGLLPVSLFKQIDLQSMLRQGSPAGSGGKAGSRAQHVLVVAQLAAAVVLLTGAGLMAKTVIRLSHLDLGFVSRGLVDGTPSLPHPWRVKEKYVPVTRQIVTELAALPGAARVAVRAAASLGPRGAPPKITLDGQPNPLASSLVPAAAVAVDTGYFTTLGIPLIRGRVFAGTDVEAGPPVAVINRWAADHWWPGLDPIGRTIRVDTAGGMMAIEVIGVVGDSKAAAAELLLAGSGADLYRPLDQSPSAFPTFTVRAQGSVIPLLKPIKATLARLVPDRPLFATPVQDQVDQQLSGVRINASQILGFAAIGLLLAVIGVYGVLSYAVGRRTQEIGIRGALGASRQSIGRMVIKDALRLAGIGIAVGLPVAVAAGRGIASILHGTNPADPGVLLVVSGGIVLVAVAASWLPARRAANVDPLVALRTG